MIGIWNPSSTVKESESSTWLDDLRIYKVESRIQDSLESLRFLSPEVNTNTDNKNTSENVCYIIREGKSVEDMGRLTECI